MSSASLAGADVGGLFSTSEALSPVCDCSRGNRDSSHPHEPVPVPFTPLLGVRPTSDPHYHHRASVAQTRWHKAEFITGGDGTRGDPPDTPGTLTSLKASSKSPNASFLFSSFSLRFFFGTDMATGRRGRKVKDRNPPRPQYPDTSYGVTSKAPVTAGELQDGTTGMWSCHPITAPIPKHRDLPRASSKPPRHTTALVHAPHPVRGSL